MNFAGPRAPALIACMALYGLVACSQMPNDATMRVLQAELSQQWHLCVPLGWDPVPVGAQLYYPGYTSEYYEPGVWLHPAWLGIIPKNALSEANARAAYTVLAALHRAGMVTRVSTARSFHYRLTMRAMPYYVSGNSFGANPDHLPYLCYSRLVPTRIIRMNRKGAVLRVSFKWAVTPNAQWARVPAIRAYSVELPPVSNPAVAIISRSRGWTHISRITTTAPMLPRPVDPAQWPVRTSAGP